MKQVRNLFFVMMGLLALSFTLTSCDDDDDNGKDANYYRTLTATEKAAVLDAVVGTYTGQFYTVNYSCQYVLDSIEGSVTMGKDTTFVINNLPTSLLSAYLSVDGESSLLEEAPSVNIGGTYYALDEVYAPYYEAGIYQYMMTPQDQVTLTAGTNTVTLYFSTYIMNAYSGGFYTMCSLNNSKKLTVCLDIAGIKVGESLYSVNRPIYFIGDK